MEKNSEPHAVVAISSLQMCGTGIELCAMFQG